MCSICGINQCTFPNEFDLKELLRNNSFSPQTTVCFAFLSLSSSSPFHFCSRFDFFNFFFVFDFRDSFCWFEHWAHRHIRLFNINSRKINIVHTQWHCGTHDHEFWWRRENVDVLLQNSNSKCRLLFRGNQQPTSTATTQQQNEKKKHYEKC